MGEVILSVDHVSKKYSRSLRHSMLYGAFDICRNFVGLNHNPDQLRKTEFWAVNNISFQLKQGDSLALIGSNGSGKSTMLKMISGIFMPDKGNINLNATVAALIEVGAGFHPMLTGRENVYINGQILGMTKQEVKDKFDEIIAFSEIEEAFMDTPVKYYSSGMYARLGFSIAIHSQPDILLVDEVLAVGDLGFAIKCAKKVFEYRNSGGSIILVTHGMHNVKHQCDYALWIEKGIFQNYGDSVDIANKYEQYMLHLSGASAGEIIATDDNIQIQEVKYKEKLQAHQPLELEISVFFNREVQNPIFMMHLHSNVDESLIFSHYSNADGYHWDSLKGSVMIKIVTKALSLRTGTYKFSFSISEKEMSNHLVWHHKKYSLTIENPKETYGILDVAPEYYCS
ncbi:ABC transporter ATP-binding protein [Deltaproteobacteria bacterium TL4]